MRPLAFLRSRRLAVSLLVAITAYSFVATWLDPQGVATGPTVDEGASGLLQALFLDRPFLSPLFLAAIGLMTLSTAACAWERTRSGIRAMRSESPDDRTSERLLRSPQLTIVAAEGMDRGAVAAAAVQSLKGVRLKTAWSGSTLVARGSALGLVGSAAFHWGLVGLFVFAGVGQLTRYEGYVNVLPGGSVQDLPTAYDLELVAGSFVGSAYTGLTLTTVEVDTNLVVAGQERGGAALVALSGPGGEIKRQWVYPNSPLKHGALIVHRSQTPPVLIGRIEAEAAEDAGGVTLYFDIETRDSRAFAIPSVVTSEPIQVSVTPLGDQRLEVSVASGGEETTETVGIGDRVELPDGRGFIVDDLTYAAQLQVVNDWSVPWIYAMFVLGTIGVSLAVFVPVRSVWMTVTDAADGRVELRVIHSRRRNDPVFPRVVRETLAQALDSEVIDDREASE